MLTELTADQRRLADYMSELSEEAYAAGWRHGPENAMWEVAIGRSDDTGD
jgi:hypothetical protein